MAMTEHAKNPKLDDVAARAGVSTATVSRFFNDPDKVSKETAERIRAVVSELGYVPNLIAGGLASNKSRLVAVLIPQLVNNIFEETIEAMIAEIMAAGSVVMIGLLGIRDTNAEGVVKAALGRRADAIIATRILDEGLRDILRRSKTPVIEIWDRPDDPIGYAVGFSHEAAGRDIARFLKTRGYLRPHVITARGPRAQARRDAMVREWEALGGAPPTEDSVDIPSRFGHARAAFANIRRLEHRPDVVVCGSDWLAQGMIVEAQASGLRVPQDIAVIGFGNSSVAGEMRPTITTVDVDGARIARETIALLARHAQGAPPKERHIDVGFRIIARESA